MDANPTDAELVEQARRGPQPGRRAAFAELVVRYEGFLRRMLFSLSGNAAVAEDLAQDAFLNAWLKLTDLHEPAAFAGWLKQMAYRQFLHHVRRQVLEQKHAPAPPVEAGVTMALPDHEELSTLLAQCAPLEQELLVLCYGFEFTYAEIAQARGMAVGTVKSHVHRAKARIRDYLQLEAQEYEERKCHG